MTTATLTDILAGSEAELTAALTAAYGAGGDDGTARAIEAEIERRETAARRRRAALSARSSDPVRAAWFDAAYAQYQAAEAACNGALLSHAGHKAADKIAAALEQAGADLAAWPWPRLWTGPQWEADRYASEELRRYWETHPRLTFTQYRDQISQQEEAYAHDREMVSDDAGEIRQAAARHADSAAAVDGIRAGSEQASRPDGDAGHARAAGRQHGHATGASMNVDSATRQPSAVVSAARDGYGDSPADKLRERAADIERRKAAASAQQPSTDVAVREGVVVTYDSDPPEPIDGAELLGHLAGYFGTYVSFPSTAAHVTVSLWNAAASARERDDSGIGPLIWRALALLGLTSGENKSGKSTVMDLSGMVQGVQRPVKITGRALAHKLGRKHQAVMLDEVKVTFGAGGASREVQAVMLAAYSRRGSWDYQRGNADVSIPCFGPVAYAAKDELITATGEQLVDIFDRTIFIRMRRPRALMPQTDVQAEDDGAALGQSLAEWTSSVKGQLIARERELADLDYRASQAAAGQGREVDARRPQIWRPLLAVADVAGAPWPALARQAMRELTDGAPAPEAASKMTDLRERAARFAPVAFLEGGTAGAGDLDEDYDEDEDLL